MNWSEVRPIVMERVSAEIRNDPNRLKDFLKGAEETYKIFKILLEDDLK